jgi:hypothetical protein
MRIATLFLIAGVFMANETFSQAAVPAAAPPACSGVEHRQFDFWLGEWTVMGGQKGDQLQGHNRIERSNNGCHIVEHWSGVGGSEGTSLNTWDSQYKVWRQFWVGGDGTVLRLEGGIQEGTMVMQGELPNGKGGIQKQKITWTPKADGSVTQRWEVSDDDGKTWAISFLGIYTKTK